MVMNQVQAIDLTHVYRKYKGKWVGLKDDHKTVIASGSTPSEVMDKAKQKGFANPELFKVPKKSLLYVGVCLG